MTDSILRNPPRNKSVLVLGDNASGKTSLIAKLHGVRVPYHAFGIEYAYIDVPDKPQDDVARLDVWILDGDPVYKKRLIFALDDRNFSDTLVILTISMATPWMWMDQLQHWMKILTEHVATLKIAPEEKYRCQLRLTTAWQNYWQTIDTGSPTRGKFNALPLPKGVLTNNLGLDVIIVVTKTDYMIALDKEYDFRSEHFAFMQQSIRRFCLMYGASLFYTSAKEGKNCDLLYQYLMHRMHGLPFRTSAQIVEKDKMLIPAGWDNSNKIAKLSTKLYTIKPNDYYNDIITKPSWSSVVKK
uniref:Dynein light intermediate chain n=1 Tax=Anopheles funestus TaxID=62324 RepID=A0A182RG51_ANOFN